MIIHATLIRASLEAAIAHCNIAADGAAFPNELFTNAGKYHAAANYNLMVRHLHDIAGGAVLTAPALADLENAEVGHLVRKYMATSTDVDGEYRSALIHAIRDLTADTLRRLEVRHQPAGRRRALRPAHRDPQALRPRRRQAQGARRGGAVGERRPLSRQFRRWPRAGVAQGLRARK